MNNAPFVFCTTTIELIQDVGFFTGTTMSCWTIPSKISLSCSLKATGTGLGAGFTCQSYDRAECCTHLPTDQLPCGRFWKTF